MAKAIKHFKQTTIVFPENTLMIRNGAANTCASMFNKRTTFVIYYEDDDCQECDIAHLSDLMPLYSLADEQNIDIRCLFSPKENEVRDVIEHLKSSGFGYDVFVDIEHSFKQSNPEFPADKRFHMFCVNDQSRPIFVGNPCTNRNAYNVFLKSMK
ncbi:MAG: hypothetical protein IKS22_01005 [Bacteroidales bacterium]|nr:hypothetical protein [Bacteroidales bacterium]